MAKSARIVAIDVHRALCRDRGHVKRERLDILANNGLQYQALCLPSGAAPSPSRRQGCCPGAQPRLGYDQYVGEAVHARATRPRGSSFLSPCCFSGNLPLHASRQLRGIVSSRGPGGLDNYQVKTLENQYMRAQLARAELRSFFSGNLHSYPPGNYREWTSRDCWRWFSVFGNGF
jgi:hypothetical protein